MLENYNFNSMCLYPTKHESSNKHLKDIKKSWFNQSVD